MSEANLFNPVRVRINGKCETMDMREQAQPCGYFIGKPKDGPCKRCGFGWLPHWPELNRPRRVGSVRQICDVCSSELESAQHREHCGG